MEEDLRKLHGLLSAMHEEQLLLGRALLTADQQSSDAAPRIDHIASSSSMVTGAEENLQVKLHSLMNHLQGVESEGVRLLSDLSHVDQFLSSLPLSPSTNRPAGEAIVAEDPTADPIPSLKQLEHEVHKMTLMQQDTGAHLAELGEVLSACLDGLSMTRRQHDPSLATSTREAELMAELEATQKALHEERSRKPEVVLPTEEETRLQGELEMASKALQSERDRSHELDSALASLQSKLEQEAQTQNELEQRLKSLMAQHTEELERANAQQKQLQIELDQANARLDEERSRATKAKKRMEQENKKNMKLFQELKTDMKEQCNQVAVLEAQNEKLTQELHGERDTVEALQKLTEELRLASEQKEKDLQQSLQRAEDEAASLRQAIEKATAQSEEADKRKEIEEHSQQMPMIQEKAELPRELQDLEKRYLEVKDELRGAKEEWEQERQQHIAKVAEFTITIEQMKEELEHMRAARQESQDAATSAKQRATAIEQAMEQTTAELAQRNSELERYRSEDAILAQLRTHIQALEERVPVIEAAALQRGRDEVATSLNSLQNEYCTLNENFKTLKHECDSYKAEAEELRGELAQLREKFSSQQIINPEHARRRLALDAFVDTDKLEEYTRSRPNSASSKEQDMTDLLQSDELVGIRNPRRTSISDRADPVNYLSEELTLTIFARLSSRDLLSLSHVSRNYRRIASDPSLWKSKCTEIWNFADTDNYSGSDWREVYIHRLTRYKQVSCVVVGDAGSGKKTLITAFEGMATQRGWNRGQERDRCTVCVESLYGVPTMFNLTVLSYDPRDPDRSLTTSLKNYLNSKRLDVFIVCVPATPLTSSSSYHERFEPVEKRILPILDALCPSIPRLLVGTETDKRDDRGLSHATLALPHEFAHFEEKLHFNTTVFTSAMSNRGLVDLFDAAQRLVPTPTLRFREHQAAAIASSGYVSPVGVQKVEAARKPPRNVALSPRASTQITPTVDSSGGTIIGGSLQTSPSSPRRRPVTPVRGSQSSRGSTSVTPYTPYTPAAPPNSAHAMPPVSPYVYNQNMSQSTPLPGDRRGSLASASTTPGMRSPQRLSSSMSERSRALSTPDRERKCILQ